MIHAVQNKIPLAGSIILERQQNLTDRILQVAQECLDWLHHAWQQIVDLCAAVTMRSTESFSTRRKFQQIRTEMQTNCHKSLFERMVASTIGFELSYFEIINSFKNCNIQISDSEVDQIASFVSDINKMISQLKDTYQNRTLFSIRRSSKAILEKLTIALQSPAYQKLKDQNLPAIEFLKTLCYNIYFCDDTAHKASAIFSRFVEQIESLKASFIVKAYSTNEEIVKHLREITELTAECGFHHHTPAGVAHHHFFNPEYYVHSELIANSKVKGDYDPFQAGNVPTRFADIVLSDRNGQTRTIHHVMAGTPTLGTRVHPITYGLLEAMKKRGEHLLQFNVQSPFNNEHKRSQALLELNSTHSPVVTVHSDSVDTPQFHKGKDLLNDGKYHPRLFHEKFKKLLENANKSYEQDGLGYFFDKPDHLEQALDATTELFEKCQNQLAALTEEKKARLHQFTFQVIKNLGEMIWKVFEKGDIYFVEHCKENIDRGAVKNLASTLLLRFLQSTDPISAEEMRYIASPVLARAQLSANRSIYAYRLEPLLQMLEHIPHDCLLNAVRQHLNNIHCPPCQVRLTFG